MSPASMSITFFLLDEQQLNWHLCLICRDWLYLPKRLCPETRRRSDTHGNILLTLLVPHWLAKSERLL